MGPLSGVSQRHLASSDSPTIVATSPIREREPPHYLTSVDPCPFDPKVEVGLPWIHGPIVIHLGGAKIDLQTNLLTVATDLPAMQPPLGAIKHCWMARRCRGRSADVPQGRSTPPASPPPQLCLQVPPALYML
jgi:hypothetical protein